MYILGVVEVVRRKQGCQRLRLDIEERREMRNEEVWGQITFNERRHGKTGPFVMPFAASVPSSCVRGSSALGRFVDDSNGIVKCTSR